MREKICSAHSLCIHINMIVKGTRKSLDFQQKNSHLKILSPLLIIDNIEKCMTKNIDIYTRLQVSYSKYIIRNTPLLF